MCFTISKKLIELTTRYIQNLNKYEIFHNADTEFSSSGSPIICINNHKVIGIHRCTRKNGKTNNILNFGSFIKYILENINYTILCEYYDYYLYGADQILNC